MTDLPHRDAIGTLLRHLLEQVDGGVAATYRELGLPPDYRPRFSPALRALSADGPMSIRELAAAIGVTHSAASQTVAQLVRCELVRLEPGADARQRIVELSDKATAIFPLVEREWQATAAAMRQLDDELPMPLAEVLTQTLLALRRKPMERRIIEAGLDI